MSYNQLYNLANILGFTAMVVGIVGLFYYANVMSLSGREQWRMFLKMMAALGTMSLLIATSSAIFVKLEKRFWVPVNEEIEVKARINGLAENSFLYSLGLRNEDLVVRMDGELLKSGGALQSWWHEKDLVTLTVLRNGQEVEVTLKKQ